MEALPKIPQSDNESILKPFSANKHIPGGWAVDTELLMKIIVNG